MSSINPFLTANALIEQSFPFSTAIELAPQEEVTYDELATYSLLDNAKNFSLSCQKLQRLSYHLLLDRNLLGSPWEGGEIKSMGEGLLTLLKESSMDKKNYDAIERTFLCIIAISEQISSDYTDEELFDILWNSLQITLKEAKDTEEAEKRASFHEIEEKCDRLSVFDAFKKQRGLDHGSCDSLEELTDRVRERFYEALTLDKRASGVKRRKTGTSEPLSNAALKQISYLRQRVDAQFFSQLIVLFDKRNKNLALDLEQQMQNLSIGQQLIIPAGYYSHPHSHAMAVRFFRESEETFTISILNTGAGVEAHRSFANCLHEESKLLYRFNHIHDALFCFKNVPMQSFISQDQTFSPLIGSILRVLSQEQYLKDKATFCSTNRIAKLYHVLSILLFPLEVGKIDDSSFLRADQRSGTCVTQIYKLILSLHYRDQGLNHKKLLLELKTQALLSLYNLYEQTKDPIQQKHLQQCSQNIIDSIYTDFQRGAEPSDYIKQALATAIEIIKKITQSPPKEATSPLNHSLFNELKTFSAAERDVESDALIKVRKATASIAISQIVSSSHLLTYPTLEGTISSLCQDLCTILSFTYTKGSEVKVPKNISADELFIFAKDFLSLDFEERLENQLLQKWICDYILSLPMPNHWHEPITQAKSSLKLLSLIFPIVENINLSSTDTFFIYFKLYVLSAALVKQLHPSVLANYPLDCFGITEDAPMLNFTPFTLEMLQQIDDASTWISDHNRQAPAVYRRPLFQSCIHLEEKTNFDSSNIINVDPSVDLALELIKNHPQLKEHIIRSSHNKDTQLFKYPVYLAGLLLSDENLKKGLMATCNLEEWTCLKLALTKTYLWSVFKRKNCSDVPHFSFNPDKQRYFFSYFIDKNFLKDRPYALRNLKRAPSVLDKIVKGSFHQKIAKRKNITPTEVENLILSSPSILTSELKNHPESHQQLFEKIYIASLFQENRFENTLEILLHSNALTILFESPLLQDFFFMLFSSYKPPRDSRSFFLQKITTSQSLKELYEKFYLNTIEKGSCYLGQQKNKTNFLNFLHKLTKQVMGVKKMLQDDSFLCDLLDTALATENTSIQAAISTIFLHEFSEKPCLSTLKNIARFHKNLQKNNAALCEHLLILHKEDLATIFSCKESALELIAIFDTLPFQELSTAAKNLPYFDPERGILWTSAQKNTIGIQLLTHRIFSKDNELLTKVATKADHESVLPYAKHILCCFDDCKLAGSEDINYISCIAGQFTIEEQTRTIITLQLSETWATRLPQEIQKASFHRITDLIYDDDEETSNPTRPPLSIHDNILEEYQFLFDLFVAERPLFDVFYTKENNVEYFLAVDLLFHPCTMLKISEGTSLFRDLEYGSNIVKIDETLQLQRFFQGANFIVYEKDDHKTIIIQKGEPLEITLHIKDHNIYLDPKTCLSQSVEAPYPFNNKALVLCLAESSKPHRHHLFLSGSFIPDNDSDVSNAYQEHGSEKRSIYYYRIEDGIVQGATIYDTLYLSFLKGLRGSSDMWSFARKTFFELHLDYKNDEKVLAYCKKFSAEIAFYLRSSHQHKDFLSHFAIQLASIDPAQCQYLKQSEPNLIPYYIHEARVPDSYKVAITDLLEDGKMLKSKDLAADVPLMRTLISTIRPSMQVQPRLSFVHSIKSTPLYSLSEIVRVFAKADPFHQKKIVTLICLDTDFKRPTFEYVLAAALHCQPELISILKLDSQASDEAIRTLLQNPENYCYIEKALEPLYKQKPQEFTSIPLFLKQLPLRGSTWIPSSCSSTQQRFYRHTPAENGQLRIDFLSSMLEVPLNLLRLQASSDAVAACSKNILCTSKRALEETKRLLIPEESSNLSILLPVQESNISSTFLESRKVTSLPIIEDHFSTFLSILDKLIEARENMLQGYVQGEHAYRNSLDSSLSQIAMQHSYQLKEYDFEDLVRILLQPSRGKILTQLNLLSSQDMISTLEQEKIISYVREQVCDLLVLKIYRRKLKALSHKDFLSFQKGIENLCHTFSDLRVNLISLVFEYYSEMHLFPTQQAAIEALTKKQQITCPNGKTRIDYISSVAQVMMGQGKSSTIIPILAYECASNNRICVVITPQSQKHVLYEQLKRSQMNAFYQDVETIDLIPATATEEQLENLHKKMTESLTEKNSMFIMTPQELQYIDLELQKTMLEGQSQKRMEILLNIKTLLKTQCDAIIDEFASVANVCTVTNVPLNVGMRDGRLSSHSIALCKKILHTLCSGELGKKSRIASNEQSYLCTQEVAALQLALMQMIVRELAIPLPQAKEAIEKFLQESLISDEILQSLKSYCDQDLIDDLGLYHYILYKILPKVLSRSGGRNYGRSLDPSSSGMVVPYHGAGSPASTVFGNPWEAIMYHLMLSVQQGTSADILDQCAKYLINKIQISKESKVDIDNFPEAKIFYKATGVLLSQSTEEALSKAAKDLNAQRRQGHYARLLELEQINIELYVTLPAKYLTSTPHDLCSFFSSVRGLTGTPWNHPTYSTCLQKNLLIESSLDKKIQESFIHKLEIEGFERFVHPCTEISPTRILDEIYAKMPSALHSMFRALIDCGGLFKDFESCEVAGQLLQVLVRQFPQEKKLFVLFFDKEENRTEASSPAALMWDPCQQKITKKTLPSFSAKVLEQHGILDCLYFVYFDEIHSFGIDTVFPEDAKAFITAGPDTKISDFLQGLLRLRSFEKNQNALVLIHQKLQDKEPQCTYSRQEFLHFLQKNEDKLISSSTFLSYKQQISHAIRCFFLHAFAAHSSNPSIKKLLEGVLVQQDLLDPMKLSMQNDAIDSPLDSLLHFAQMEMARVQPILEKIPAAQLLHTQIHAILLQATQTTHLRSKVDVYQTSTEVVIHNQVQQHITQSNHIHLDLLQQTIKMSTQTPLAEPTQTRVNLQAVAHFLAKNDDLYIGSCSQVGHLKDLFAFQGGVIEKFYQVFSNLYVSSNIFNLISDSPAHLFQKKKQIISLLVVERDPADCRELACVACIALTHEETEKASVLLKAGELANAFLITSGGHCLIDSPKIALLEDPSSKNVIQKSLIEAHIINADLDMLCKNKESLKLWLRDTPASIYTAGIDGSVKKQLLQTLSAIHENRAFTSMINSLKEYSSAEAEDSYATAIEKIQQAAQATNDFERYRSLKAFPSTKVELIPPCLLSYIPKQTLHTVESVQLLNQFPQAVLSKLRKHQIEKIYTKAHNISHKPTKLTGFQNLGNTCYFNAAAKAVLSIKNIEKIFDRQQSTLEALGDLKGELTQEITEKKQAFACIKTIFNSSKAQSNDVHEHLREFLSSNFLKTRALACDGKQKDSAELLETLYELLGMTEASECSLHLHGSYRCLTSLNIGEESIYSSIQAILELYHQKKDQKLEASDDLSLFSVQIPRRDFMQEKIGCKIENPMQTILLQKRDSPSETCIFKPTAIICYRSHHFTTLAQENGSWILHNDLLVYPITDQLAEEIAKESAYIFIFEKED